EGAGRGGDERGGGQAEGEAAAGEAGDLHRLRFRRRGATVLLRGPSASLLPGGLRGRRRGLLRRTCLRRPAGGCLGVWRRGRGCLRGRWGVAGLAGGICGGLTLPAERLAGCGAGGRSVFGDLRR